MKKSEAQSAQSQRLKKLITALNISVSQFSREINRKQPYISRVVAGYQAISGNILNSIAHRYNYVNIQWLLTGEGEMFISKGSKDTLELAEPPPPEYTYQGLTLRDLEQMVISQSNSIKNLNKRVGELEDILNQSKL